MTTNDSDSNLFSFKDDEIEPADLEKRLRAQATERPSNDRWWPVYGQAIGGESAGDGDTLRQQIDHHLASVQRLLAASGTRTEPILASSPATRLPLIGRLWGAIRQQVHGLILFYLNRQRADQAEITHHLLQAVTALERDNRRLSEQLARLEAESAGSPTDDR